MARTARPASLWIAIVLAALSAATCGLTIASAWCNMWVAWSDKCVAAFHGQIAYRWGFSNPSVQILSPGVHARKFHPDWDWFRPVYSMGAFGAVNAPLWIIAPAIGAVAILLWRRARRIQRAGRCPGCLYDLAGLDGRRTCPECGRILRA